MPPKKKTTKASPQGRSSTMTRTPARKVATRTTTAPAKGAKKPASAPAAGSATKTNPTVEVVREIAALAEAHGVVELSLETQGLSLTLRRGPAAVEVQQAMMPAPMAMPQMTMAAPSAPPPPAAAPAAEPARAADDGHNVVTSPFVGTFYRSPGPDAAAYVEVGSRVEKGQILCIVEAMKLMNEIEADQAGIISAILVDNAKPVEYGQPLFKLAPA